MLGAHFLVTLVFAGMSYIIAKRQKTPFGYYVVSVACGIGALLTKLVGLGISTVIVSPGTLTHSAPSLFSLFIYGLRSGLLTFGGAYTVIPFAT